MGVRAQRRLFAGARSQSRREEDAACQSGHADVRAEAQPHLQAPPLAAAERPRCVLVIGSGPVIIGQAAEFDYAGTQACKALREEGIRVVLVNSNPATIMTDDQLGGRRLHRAPHRPGGGADHRRRTSRRPARHPRWPDRPQPGRRPRGCGRAGAVRGPAPGDLAGGHPHRRGPRAVQGAAPAHRRARTGVADRGLAGRCPQVPRRGRASPGGAARLHPGGDRRRAVLDRGAVRRGGEQRARRLADRPGAGGALTGRLARDRIRGDAGRGRDLHHDLQHGEPRSDGRAHRRLHRGGAGADPHRPRAPAAPQRGAADHQRARDRGRLQRPVRPGTRRLGLPRHRGQPPGVAVLGPGQQGHRIPDRPAGRQDRGRPPPRRDPQRGDRQDLRRLRAGSRLLRGQDPALAVRQVPRGRPAARDPDEVHRRGDGHRAQLRGRLQQGAALAGAAAPAEAEIRDPVLLDNPNDRRIFAVMEALRRGASVEEVSRRSTISRVVRGPAPGPGRGRGEAAAGPRRRHPDHRQADGALRPADRRAVRCLPDRGGRCPRGDSGSRPPSSASTPAPPSSPRPRPTTTPPWSPRTSARRPTATPWWCWAAVRSASARASSSTTAASRPPRPCAGRGSPRSWSTATRRR